MTAWRRIAGAVPPVQFAAVAAGVGLGALAGCDETPGAAPAATVEAAPPPAGAVDDGVRVRFRGTEPALVMPGGERKVIRSVLDIKGPMPFGGYVWNENDVPAGGPVWVRVDVARQLISVFRGDDEIGAAVILYGAPGKPTPTGAFTVLQKARDYHSRTYDAPMPFMLRITDDGVAIHASRVRAGWATHGCIGVPDAFARRLFAAVPVGADVFIVGRRPSHSG